VSRAFVKEGEDRPERPPPRAVSDRPNYVTQRGLELLREALARAGEAGDARNADYYEERLADAVLVDAHPGDRDTIEFGSKVRVRESNVAPIVLQIVGEDEADPAHGTISWVSPYAQALIGHRVGDRVVVQRPAGAATVVVEAIDVL
jgi:transcription elongation factor GreB